ncbi:hypothetical protein ALFP_1638 [Alcaligenes faecalis]|nr:hypothetical protein ALFP_1638 [Alcaligenes faecalis]
MDEQDPTCKKCILIVLVWENFSGAAQPPKIATSFQSFRMWQSKFLLKA